MNSGIFSLCFVFGITLQYGINQASGLDTWELHRWCNRDVLTFGGVVTFDSSLLAGTYCQMNIVANGSGPAAWSLYFTYFDVTPGCPANVTLIEDTSYGTVRTDPPPGLYQSFCKNDPYLNENLMYTTNGPRLSLVYKKTDTTTYTGSQTRMAFTLKLTTFKAGVMGCTKYEQEQENMMTCVTRRCIHRSLVCQELNPCGDFSDCSNSSNPVITSTSNEGGGFYVRYLILTGVAIFLLFASFQVCLLVRRKRPNPCHTPANSKPRHRLHAEQIMIGDHRGGVTANGTVRKGQPDSESLIEYHVES